MTAMAHLLRPSEVKRRRYEPVGVIVEQPKSPVAVAAKQSAHDTSVVIVVNLELALTLAHRALALLVFNHVEKVVRCDAVPSQKFSAQPVRGHVLGLAITVGLAVGGTVGAVLLTTLVLTQASSSAVKTLALPRQLARASIRPERVLGLLHTTG
jgi:hypothetical protein